MLNTVHLENEHNKETPKIIQHSQQRANINFI